MKQDTRPNILYFLADNLGFGELGCYGGGVLRGTSSHRIDEFAAQGMKLLNFAPEAQCSPSRAALQTGRHAIRTGNASVALPGMESGIVSWEKTMGDVLSAAGYDCFIVGKWHIGDKEGRLPTDHGFLKWYGIPRSYDECAYADDPSYDPGRDIVPHVVESVKGGRLKENEVLTKAVRRDIDIEYKKRAKEWMKSSMDAGRPFYMYFNCSNMHMPVIPREEFNGRTRFGNMADGILQMDADFGEMLDYLKEIGVEDDTLVVFSGDNGAEEEPNSRGYAGFFEGSYFTGSEGSLRTPALIRFPGKVPGGRSSDEPVHITDMFTTLVNWGGGEVPADRVIDGVDQRDFFEGRQENSAREGFLYWNGPTLYGAKWRHYKMKLVLQTYMYEPALRLPTPHIINLKEDPRERNPFPIQSLWVVEHAGRLIQEYKKSLQREQLIPTGAPLDFVPKSADELRQARIKDDIGALEEVLEFH